MFALLVGCVPIAVAVSSRSVAHTVLQRCFSEQAVFADRALNGVLEQHPSLSSADISHATELVYGVLRHSSMIDYHLVQLTNPKLTRKTELRTLCALRIGAYELLHLSGTPDFAAVNEAVSLVGKAQWKRKFCNGVLRSLARQRDSLTLPADDTALSPLAALATETSTPEWLLQSLADTLLPSFDELSAWARATQQRPEMAFRVNTCQTSREVMCEMLAHHNITVEASAVGLDETLQLRRSGGKVTSLPGFSDGMWTVQDLGAQCVAVLAAPEREQTILDVCSAPGGKATHLAELSEDSSRVIAVELHPRKSRLIEEARDRLKLSCIDVHVADAADAEALQALCPPDGVHVAVLDAPCSGMGTLRRNPEHRHRDVDQSRLEGLCELQDRLLASVARNVKVGGTLTYSVCSPLQVETDERIANFLETHANFVIERFDDASESYARLAPFVSDSTVLGPNSCIRTWTHLHPADSHFAAKVRRIA